MSRNDSNDKYVPRSVMEDTGEDFEGAAFLELLTDMAAKARFLSETLDILAGTEQADTAPEDTEESGYEDDDGTDVYLISGGSFRLLAGDLYDLYTRYFNLEKRLAEARSEKDFRKIQKGAFNYDRHARRLCRRWGLPKDGDAPWGYYTLEETLRKKILTPAYPVEDEPEVDGTDDLDMDDLDVDDMDGLDTDGLDCLGDEAYE